MESLVELFCDVDDFCQAYYPIWNQKQLQDGSRKRNRKGQLTMSEIVTILIWYHQSNYRTFKAYYTEYVQVHMRSEFPNLVSYPRFVVLMPRSFRFLCVYLPAQLVWGMHAGFLRGLHSIGRLSQPAHPTAQGVL